MNKIYKVVWNNTLQCYTVVSELAKSHTKNNASKVIKATVLSSILAVTSSSYAAQVGGGGKGVQFKQQIAKILNS